MNKFFKKRYDLFYIFSFLLSIVLILFLVQVTTLSVQSSKYESTYKFIIQEPEVTDEMYSLIAEEVEKNNIGIMYINNKDNVFTNILDSGSINTIYGNYKIESYDNITAEDNYNSFLLYGDGMSVYNTYENLVDSGLKINEYPTNFRLKGLERVIFISTLSILILLILCYITILIEKINSNSKEILLLKINGYSNLEIYFHILKKYYIYEVIKNCVIILIILILCNDVLFIKTSLLIMIIFLIILNTILYIVYIFSLRWKLKSRNSKLTSSNNMLINVKGIYFIVTLYLKLVMFITVIVLIILGPKIKETMNSIYSIDLMNGYYKNPIVSFACQNDLEDNFSRPGCYSMQIDNETHKETYYFTPEDDSSKNDAIDYFEDNFNAFYMLNISKQFELDYKYPIYLVNDNYMNTFNGKLDSENKMYIPKELNQNIEDLSNIKNVEIYDNINLFDYYQMKNISNPIVLCIDNNILPSEILRYVFDNFVYFHNESKDVSYELNKYYNDFGVIPRGNSNFRNIYATMVEVKNVEIKALVVLVLTFILIQIISISTLQFEVKRLMSIEGKEIVLKKLNGYGLVQRYKTIYKYNAIFDIVQIVLALVIGNFLSINYLLIILISTSIMIINNILISIAIISLESKEMIMILRGDND